MVIGIDGNEANVSKRVGVSVYSLNLLKYFKKRANKETQFIVYLKSSPLSDLPLQNQYFSYKVVSGPILWSQIFLPIYLYIKRSIDVFFSPAHYAPRYCPVPTVVTIHDLSFFYYPDDFLKKDLYKLENWTRYSIKQAKKIIAVSQTTKKDLMKLYELQDSQIDVVYNGYEKEIHTPESKFIMKTRKKPYILYVGTLQPRKNVTTLIQGFSLFKKNNPEFELIIAGKKGWLYDSIFNEVDELGLNKDIFFTDFVTDQQLTFLYKNAFCFVMPSFYEGFGLPVLEAMSFNCPVITSFNSSLPEIGGNACLYFDPTNKTDLVDKLQILKNQPNTRAELIKEGKKQLTQFSWEKCSNATLEIIKKAARI